MAGELLRNKAGIDLLPVHYRGAAPALLAMRQGEIDLYFESRAPGASGPQVRTLAVSTRWRWPLAAGRWPPAFRVLGGSSADLQARVARDLAYWGEVIRNNHIQLE